MKSHAKTKQVCKQAQSEEVKGSSEVLQTFKMRFFLHVSPSCLASDNSSALQRALLPSWELGNGLVWGSWCTRGHGDVVTRTSLWLIPTGTAVLSSLEDCVYKRLIISHVNFFMRPFMFGGEGQSIRSQSSRHLVFLMIPSGRGAAQHHLSQDLQRRPRSLPHAATNHPSAVYT